MQGMAATAAVKISITAADVVVKDTKVTAADVVLKACMCCSHVMHSVKLTLLTMICCDCACA